MPKADGEHSGLDTQITPRPDLFLSREKLQKKIEEALDITHVVVAICSEDAPLRDKNEAVFGILGNLGFYKKGDVVDLPEILKRKLDTFKQNGDLVVTDINAGKPFFAGVLDELHEVGKGAAYNTGDNVADTLAIDTRGEKLDQEWEAVTTDYRGSWYDEVKGGIANGGVEAMLERVPKMLAGFEKNTSTQAVEISRVGLRRLLAGKLGPLGAKKTTEFEGFAVDSFDRDNYRFFLDNLDREVDNVVRQRDYHAAQADVSILRRIRMIGEFLKNCQIAYQEKALDYHGRRAVVAGMRQMRYEKMVAENGEEAVQYRRQYVWDRLPAGNNELPHPIGDKEGYITLYRGVSDLKSSGSYKADFFRGGMGQDCSSKEIDQISLDARTSNCDLQIMVEAHHLRNQNHGKFPDITLSLTFNKNEARKYTKGDKKGGVIVLRIPVNEAYNCWGGIDDQKFNDDQEVSILGRIKREWIMSVESNRKADED